MIKESIVFKGGKPWLRIEVDNRPPKQVRQAQERLAERQKELRERFGKVTK